MEPKFLKTGMFMTMYGSILFYGYYLAGKSIRPESLPEFVHCRHEKINITVK